MSYGIPRLNSFMSFCDYMQKKRVMERRPNVIPSPKKCRWLNNKKSFSFFFFSFFFFFKSVEYLSWKDCYIQSLYGISFSSWKEKRDKNDEIHKFKRREVNPLLFLPHLYENRFCWRATQLPWLANLICFLFLLQVCVLPPFFQMIFSVFFFPLLLLGRFHGRYVNDSTCWMCIVYGRVCIDRKTLPTTSWSSRYHHPPPPHTSNS